MYDKLNGLFSTTQSYLGVGRDFIYSNSANILKAYIATSIVGFNLFLSQSKGGAIVSVVLASSAYLAFQNSKPEERWQDKAEVFDEIRSYINAVTDFAYKNAYLTSACSTAVIVALNVGLANNKDNAFLSVMLTTAGHLITTILERDGKITPFTKGWVDNAMLIFALKQSFALAELMPHEMPVAIKSGIPLALSYGMIGGIDQILAYLATKNKAEFPNTCGLCKAVTPHYLAQPVKFIFITKTVDDMESVVQTAIGGFVSYAVRSLSLPSQHTKLFSVLNETSAFYESRSKLFSAPNAIAEALDRIKSLIHQQLDNAGHNKTLQYKQILAKTLKTFDNAKHANDIIENLPAVVERNMLKAGMALEDAKIIKDNIHNIAFWHALRDGDDKSYIIEGAANVFVKAISGSVFTVLYGVAKTYPSIDLAASFGIRALESIVGQKWEPALESVVNKFFNSQAVFYTDLVPLVVASENALDLVSLEVTQLTNASVPTESSVVALSPLHDLMMMSPATHDEF